VYEQGVGHDKIIFKKVYVIIIVYIAPILVRTLNPDEQPRRSPLHLSIPHELHNGNGRKAKALRPADYGLTGKIFHYMNGTPCELNYVASS
jgi:hypothetical protein